MSPFFETTTHGKWILAGEHAVLRGSAALVFPILTKKLTLSFEPSKTPLHAVFLGESRDTLGLLFWKILEHSFQLLGKTPPPMTGCITLHSDIPPASGMGASAALSVAVSRLLGMWYDWSPTNILDFSKKLEDFFHGKSSGLDIAGAAATQGILFQNGIGKLLMMTWKPHLYLSPTDTPGITAQCIQRVASLWQTDQEKAKAIDIQMSKSVEIAKRALITEENKRLIALSEAIKMACNCFEKWQLITPPLHKHIETLKKKGAIAVKPTGSGMGGYLLSLFQEQPSNVPIDWIKL